jgi:predicted anti-sigma-YlaC factor YlaD
MRQPRAVAPPTPAEAPHAKRRTAARWRGWIVLMVATAIVFAIFAVLVLLRLRHQVFGKPSF